MGRGNIQSWKQGITNAGSSTGNDGSRRRAGFLPLCSQVYAASLAETPGITNLQVNPGTVEFWRRQSTTLATVAPKAWLIPPKNWEMDAPLSPVLPTNIPGAPPSTAQAGGKCHSWKESHHEHPMGRRNMRIGSIFRCGGKALSLLLFHLFPPSIATKQDNVLAVISISLENASPASRSNSPEPPGVAASFRQRQNHHQKSHFPSKKKGVETAPAGYSQWDGISAAACRSRKNHVTPLPASPVGFSHTHLGNATPQGIPGDSWDLTGSGCFAGHAGTCPPAERTNKLLSHSKTMKAKPQSPKVPLSHSPAAATAPQSSQNSPPPAAADPCSKGPLQRRWEAFPSRESLPERGQDGWRS
ncbi:uncharacterized protein LOC132324463 [Haemorhous mexicanus]|uniref:uncharacterized protein LOC132324463 n=1 Tax=Haemorhous mexicanus TaxID=30427 RepID=UPI0028BEBECE|nr:uncharacterized protein LOC132324463 [Haemorhous mexicanus]